MNSCEMIELAKSSIEVSLTPTLNSIVPDLSSSKTCIQETSAHNPHGNTVGCTHVENVICKLARISKGEELLVNLDEFLFAQSTSGAILDETLVPGLQFLLVDWNENGQECQINP
jgi:hypothetical protein